MVEKYPLHDIDSPLDREERLKVLENWHRITRYFNAVQGQIKILAGGEEIDEVLARIEDAITNAENATSDATTAAGKVNTALAQLDILISNTNASAQRAETAADDADQMNQILNNLKTELLALQTNLNGIVQAESQRVTNEGQRVSAEAERRTEEITRRENEAARVLKEQARETAEQNRATAESAREVAEQNRQQKLAELLVVLDQLDFKGEYNPASIYLPFNVVRFGRASYVALQELSGVQPSDDGVNWRLLAAGGIDGSGAVSTVNGIEPDELGNVQLIIDYINNLTSDRTDAGLSAAAGKVLKTLIDNHIGAGDNPHQVTAEQLALGNVQNFGVATQAEAEAGATNDKYMTPQRAKQSFDKNITTFSDSLEQVKTDLTTHLDEKASKTNYGHMKVGNGLSVVDGVVSADIPVINDATTTQKGITQLNNTVSSTSTTQAATANAVKMVNDKLLDTYWIPLAINSGFTKPFDSSTAYRKIGNRVYLKVECTTPALTGGTDTSKHAVCILPNGYRPLIYATGEVVIAYNGQFPTAITISNWDGTVFVHPHKSFPVGASIIGVVSFLVD